MNAPPVPAQVAPYVEALGIAMTVRFLLIFGGAELYYATDPKGRGRVEALVGPDRAAELGRISHRLPRRVPLAKPWLAAQLRSEGYGIADIARTLRTSDVSVRKWLKINHTGTDVKVRKNR